MNEIQQRIVCAAVRHPDTKEIILGVRHFDMLMSIIIKFLFPPETLPEGFKWEQGFIDNCYNFLSREEAWKVADEAGQIIRHVGGDKGRLFSENLY